MNTAYNAVSNLGTPSVFVGGSQSHPIVLTDGTISQPPRLAQDVASQSANSSKLDYDTVKLYLKAYNTVALKRNGLVHLRAESQLHEYLSNIAHTALARQLPSPALRRQAAQDVVNRISRILGPGYQARTIREHYKAVMVKAESWVEWGKENHLDSSFHEKQLQDLALIQQMMGPEKIMWPPNQAEQAPNPPSSIGPGRLPTPLDSRRQSLQLVDMDLSQIHVTQDPDKCHWCQAEQPWGIPGGLHFKPQPSPDSHAHPSHDTTDESNYVSTICRDCATHRYRIGTHAEHGPWLDLPSRFPIGPTAHPKTSMRLTSCDVCTGLAMSLCEGCPLRACVNCQVSLDRFCQGSMDQLIFGYGEKAVRNDARLMGSSLALGKKLRAMEAAAAAAAAAATGGVSFNTV